jgi:serine/threonine-protein kinase
MSVVFLADELDAGRQVVLKTLTPSLTVMLGATRFHQEIEFLRRLRHPNIVPILGASEVGPVLYYVMPYVPGGNLEALLESVGRLPLERVIAITRDLAAALDHAHALNVLHRDIKPGNVLLDGPVAMICDFGVARAIERAGEDRISSSGLLIGTPEYMSPEQAAGSGELDARCDIYGLGCVIYEMLAGEPAFSGPTRQAIVSRQMIEPPRPLLVVRPDLPRAVEVALQRALAKHPADRPASAAELLALLQ